MPSPIPALRVPLEEAADALGLDASALDRVAAYGAALLHYGTRTNLIGTLETERVADELLVDSLRALPLLPPAGRLIDVGSGAGLPGIPLLLARPAWSGVLLEPRRKRAAFLRHLQRALRLDIEVVEARLEDWLAATPDAAGSFDAAVSRAVFAPPRWAEVAAPLLAPGGAVLAWENEPSSLRDQLPAGWSLYGSHPYTLQRGTPRVVLALHPPPAESKEQEPHR